MFNPKSVLPVALPIRVLFIGVLGLVTACTSQSSTEPTARDIGEVAALQPQWQKVVPGGDTQCSDGSEFAFYTRSGDPKKLLFFLQGGGACWNLQTCDPLGTPSYTVNLEGFHPSQSDGIFNYSRPDNPLGDHSVVFVPYCSGDVHLGDATRNYQRTPAWINKLKKNGVASADINPDFSIAHKGLANARAALRWAQREVVAPNSVFVTGSSAGSIPSPYYAVQLANAYPDARVTQLGDGSGGYRRISQSAAPHRAWDTVSALGTEPGFASLTEDGFNFELLYTLAHATNPALQLHAYDTAEDDVQLQFLRLGGLDVKSLQPALELNQADIRSNVPKFASYIAGGELHTILRRPEFYTYRVGSRSVRDWIADVVAGQAVSSVACERCEVAQQ